ncbi:MAG: transcription antitermination factor NusB [Erysipelotrichaceae bacterium]|nr:transcription antitermination factor NusB [Erysipelotrichaceae bacterium]
MKRRDQRIRVMTCLYQYMLTEQSIDNIFDENLDIDDKKSISFIVENTIETINHLEELTELIKKNLVSTWDFDRLGFLERAILLMSAYEIKYTSTDKPIIINEAIEIAKQYCDEDAPKLINGVLDQL